MSFSGQIGSFRHDNPAPLYLQLQQLLRTAILQNVLSEKDAIPAERDLATEYGVSRITVRKAISGLVEDGLLTRRRGAGTFVRARVEKSISKLLSFAEEMSLRGRRPSSSWIGKSAGMVNPEESMSLGLSPGASVYRFQRIRYADDVAIAYESSTIAGFCLSSADAVSESLYAALEETGNRPVRALQRVRAVPLPTEYARMLDVSPGHAGLLIERRGFLHDGRAAEYTQLTYRGDAYDFVTELTDI